MLTEKKDVLVNIKLYPKLREVVLFIRDHPLQMSNKDFNESLKTVTVLAGIDKHITAHVGRHSFGRILAENGVDKKRAQKLLGHRDERSTNIYYHMMDTDIDQEVDDKLGNLS
jgi:site-specific recombinase XerD